MFHRIPWMFLVVMVMAPVRASAVQSTDPWHHPLYLSGGDYWRARLPIDVTNTLADPVKGARISIEATKAGAGSALSGCDVRSIRVCDATGLEMRYVVEDRSGRAVRDGRVEPAYRVTIPVSVDAGKSIRMYIYFDNPNAGRVPDYLSGRSGLVNGDMEIGEGIAPLGWHPDLGDNSHRVFWDDDVARSGRRSLKTVVATGATPTWISTRQSDIRLLGGARYRVEAWVKADHVGGYAGWYLHIGNEKNSLLSAPTLSAGGGTYDWKKVQLDFQAPADANRLQVGTVLRGTGTAWFDDVTLKQLQSGALKWAVQPVQRMQLKSLNGQEARRPASWPAGAKQRAVVRVFNFSSQRQPATLVAVDHDALAGRMRGRLQPAGMVVMHGRDVVPHEVIGSSLLFRAERPPRSVSTFAIYVSQSLDRSPGRGATKRLSSALAAANLVRNGSFEQGRNLPESWEPGTWRPSTDGVTMALVRPGKPGLGERAVRLHVPRKAKKAWRGWRQAVPVRPGHTYLLAAWLRCSDVTAGNVRVHTHCLTAEKRLSKYRPMDSTAQSIQGTTDWTLLSQRFTMPDDAAFLEIHLTTDTHGTVWHDGVFLAEVAGAEWSRFESRPMASDRLAVWPVPAVVKVFPFDSPPAAPTAARVACAGNEWETLQLAVRAGRRIDRLRVRVGPPRGAGGQLRDVRVNVVGLVPIDYPTNYYHSNQPPWQRMVPTSKSGCDGWPGRWPDPLLPTETLDLEPNTTRSVWITFRVPADAKPGDYQGTVDLLDESQLVARVPFTIHIWDFALPKQSHLGAIYDVRFGPGGRQRWGDTLEHWYPHIVRFMAARRLCPDTIRPQPAFQYKDGKASADFRQYDKAATWYFDQLKLPFAYTPGTFYAFGWGHPPNPLFGERPYEGQPPYEGVDRSRLRPEYKKAYQACLKVFWDHLKKKGWEKKIVLYISDEPFDKHPYIRAQMRALCEMIHEVDPAIPIYSSTWKHVPDWDGFLNVWGIGHYGRVPVEKMQQLRKEGARLWFTTDGQMCTDTPYCAVERLLPHYCFKYGVQAYEFWGVAWQTYDPYRFGWHAYISQSGEPGEQYWVRYPNGDGFLLYPPISVPKQATGPAEIVSSIRLEQARDGVEDYEYLCLLRQCMKRAQQARRDTSRAERAMHAAAELVTIPNAGGRHSTKILPDPGQLYRARTAVAEAIEQLRGQ